MNELTMSGPLEVGTTMLTKNTNERGAPVASFAI